MAETINGWTVQERNGIWQMIYKGEVHYEHKVKSYVVARAKISRLPKK